MSSHRASKMLQDTVARCRELGLRRTWALEELLKDRCDKATIFRLLVRLEKHGILRRLGLHDRSAYYTLIEPGEHSDYLICTQCGAIETLDIACPVEALEAKISQESGFKKLYHELEFFGVCPKCL
jgi:Fe2+ or Zn2+ uptake regulation protein